MASLTSEGVPSLHDQESTITNPSLQVLKLRKAGEHFMCDLSDGNFTISAILGKQVEALAEDGQLESQCIAQITKHSISNNGSIVLESVQVVAPYTDLVGNPSPFKIVKREIESPRMDTASAGSSVNDGVTPMQASPEVDRGTAMMQDSPAPSRQPPSPFTPIQALNPYARGWKLKVRVTAKSEIKTWNKERGSGKLFSVDFLDAQKGEIRAVMFNESCDRLFRVFEKDKVYVVSNGNLRIANRRFKNLRNDYELILDERSVVEPAVDDNAIGQQSFQFANIDAISQKQENALTDLCAVVTEVGAAEDFKAKSGKEFTKRTIKVTDSSLTAIEVTIFGQKASNMGKDVSSSIFSGSNSGNCLILLAKGLKVSEYNNKSLAAGFGSILCLGSAQPGKSVESVWDDGCGIQFNAVPEADELSKWWYTTGYAGTPTNVTVNTRPTGSGERGPTDELTLGQITLPSQQGKKSWATCRATVVRYPRRRDETDVFARTPYYTACANDGCSRKVMQDGPGRWHCAKCSTTHQNYDPRYLVRMMCLDHEGRQFITFFQSTAPSMMRGVSARDVARSVEEKDSYRFLKYMADAGGYEYEMLLTYEAKPDKNGQLRLAVQCARITPVDIIKESERLLERVENIV